MGLDDHFYFGGALQGQEWAFIHAHEVTARKSYHMPRWNVIYDLEDGAGFFEDSGLKDWCAGKLNPEWFMLSEQAGEEKGVLRKEQGAAESIFVGDESELDLGNGMTATTKAMAVCLALVFVMGAWAVLHLLRRDVKKNVLLSSHGDAYG